MTDMPRCHRVQLPDPVGKAGEAEIFVRTERYEQIFNDYSNRNCNTEGAQRSNLNHNQRQGLVKLKKRVKEGNIILLKTDKTDKLAVVSPDVYLEMGEVHIGDDKTITMAET